LAPISPSHITSALDIGCGRGHWILEMANAFPNCQWTGIDMSLEALSSPTSKSLPPNVSYQQANILPGFPFPDDSFDYVHQRMLSGGVPTRDWAHVMRETYRVLRPGGWCEIGESDALHFPVGPIGERINSTISSSMLLAGMDTGILQNLPHYVRDAGFIECVAMSFKLPTGHWASTPGSLSLRVWTMNLDSLKSSLAPDLSDHDFLQWKSSWAQEMEHYRSSWEMVIVYARKPLFPHSQPPPPPTIP
ncbi:MAG: S-adenosyl-L-methionine-dependent methyltransferase, partial [Piptocephalis tieghemiana]